MPSFDQTIWKRPEDICKENSIEEKPAFFKGDASSNDVRQGAIGDCWFIGALSVLATRDELIVGAGSSPMVKKGMMIDKQIASYFSMGVFPPLFHKYATRGIYVMRFFKEFKWRYVIIDDRIPVYSGNSKPMFGYCTDLSELWVPLIEKGYAKLFGCYQTLVSGFIDDGLMDLTSMVCEKKKLHDKNGFFDEKNTSTTEFWNFLGDMRENKSLMGCSASGATEREIQIDGERTGILTGHAYGLLDVIDLHCEKEDKIKKLLRVRNPWGKCEWNGPWSDYSEEIEEYKEDLDKWMSQLAEDERFNLQEEDGTFLIDYKNFRDIY
jgi:calpain, invertebrate